MRDYAPPVSSSELLVFFSSFSCFTAFCFCSCFIVISFFSTFLKIFITYIFYHILVFMKLLSILNCSKFMLNFFSFFFLGGGGLDCVVQYDFRYDHRHGINWDSVLPQRTFLDISSWLLCISPSISNLSTFLSEILRKMCPKLAVIVYSC